MCSYFIFKIDRYKLHERLPSLYLVLLKKYLHQEYYIPRNKFAVYLLLQIPSFTERDLPLLKRCKRCAPCTWWRSIFPVPSHEDNRWRWVVTFMTRDGASVHRVDVFEKRKSSCLYRNSNPRPSGLYGIHTDYTTRALWCRAYNFVFISSVLTHKLGKNVKLIVFFVHFLF